jgi:phosphatidylglycerophosphate synthase
VIAQAALYLATADDLEAALLPVAGRPVAFRTLVTAVRAGARRVGVPGIFRGTSVEAAILTSPRARAAAVWLDAGTLEPAPTLLLPAAALAPPPALAALLAAAAPAVLAGSLQESAPAVVLDAATMAAVAQGLAAGTPLADEIGRVLAGGGATAVAPGAWYVRVRDGSSARAAEDRLFAGLGSAIDTRLDRALHRRLSRHVTRAAIAVGLTPNQLSVASLLIGLAAAWCFWNATALAAAAGLLVYVVAVVLDHADGEVARLTLAESRLGEWLDILVDTVVHAALVIAMGITAQAVAGGGMALAVTGALGVIASAGVAKLWPVTSAAGGLGGALANLGSRDGFYAMLVLFIAARALAPSALPLLMIVVALGTHAYWLARALYRASEGASVAPSDASPRTEMRGQSPRSNGGKL